MMPEQIYMQFTEGIRHSTDFHYGRQAIPARRDHSGTRDPADEKASVMYVDSWAESR